jgi:serine/threonine protein kinase
MREQDVVDGRYRVERKLAAGGFGAIYAATDLVMGREVALKVLHRELASDAAVVARFRREAEALARLRDPHTITMYDVGADADGTPYIVLELLRGETLYQHFLNTGTLHWRRMAIIARGVCSSLREAHAVGIIHRDLKPANIHLEVSALQQDHVKVLDFGIAKLVDAENAALPDLTLAGQMIGTFDYMPPEQLIGGTCTGKSDVFALAVVMYEMMTGSLPYGTTEGPAGRLMTMLTTSPAPLSERIEIPPMLEETLLRALSRDVEERPTMEELDYVLDALIEGSKPFRIAAADISQMIDEALTENEDTAFADAEALAAESTGAMAFAANDDADDATESFVDTTGAPANLVTDDAIGATGSAADDDDDGTFPADDADTWVGTPPQTTTIGMMPTRPPSSPPVAAESDIEALHKPLGKREPRTPAFNAEGTGQRAPVRDALGTPAPELVDRSRSTDSSSRASDSSSRSSESSSQSSESSSRSSDSSSSRFAIGSRTALKPANNASFTPTARRVTPAHVPPPPPRRTPAHASPLAASVASPSSSVASSTDSQVQTARQPARRVTPVDPLASTISPHAKVKAVDPLGSTMSPDANVKAIAPHASTKSQGADPLQPYADALAKTAAHLHIDTSPRSSTDSQAQTARQPRRVLTPPSGVATSSMSARAEIERLANRPQMPVVRITTPPHGQSRAGSADGRPGRDALTAPAHRVWMGRPTPSEQALPPPPSMSPSGELPAVPTRMATGTTPIVNKTSRVSMTKVAVWALALFGVGFAVALGIAAL